MSSVTPRLAALARVGLSTVFLSDQRRLRGRFLEQFGVEAFVSLSWHQSGRVAWTLCFFQNPKWAVGLFRSHGPVSSVWACCWGQQRNEHESLKQRETHDKPNVSTHTACVLKNLLLTQGKSYIAQMHLSFQNDPQVYIMFSPISGTATKQKMGPFSGVWEVKMGHWHFGKSRSPSGVRKCVVCVCGERHGVSHARQRRVLRCVFDRYNAVCYACALTIFLLPMPWAGCHSFDGAEVPLRSGPFSVRECF